MIRTTPLRRTVLQLLQILLTDDFTFITTFPCTGDPPGRPYHWLFHSKRYSAPRKIIGG